jgi:SAM-dependent methyltransferase
VAVIAWRTMNRHHAQLCPSPEWAHDLQTNVLPAVADGVDFGTAMIEVGPGPGAATDWLRHRVERLVAVEIETAAAARLRERFAGTNVDVLDGDASALALPDNSFDSAASFTMLHHLPTAQLQNRLLGEVLRVLRPGGVLVGSDSLASVGLHHFHEDDVYNPVEPATFLTRLQTLGYGKITLIVDWQLKFIAEKPAE